jgi:hypothetical protein
MKAKFLLCFLITSFLLGACHKKNNLGKDEIVYKDKEAFNEVIELKGKNIVTDSIMDPRIGGMLLKNDKLIFQYEFNPPFVLFQTPTMNFIAQKGRRGPGPDEFIFPVLVPTTDPELICYIYEQTNQKLYTLDNQNQIGYCPFKFPQPSQDNLVANKHLINFGEDDFLYVESRDNGKSVFRTTKTQDSIRAVKICDLNLKPGLDDWIPYIGFLAANKEKNRAAYAYKYYKAISFIDLDAKTVKTINFKQSEFDVSTLGVADGSDMNVTHYLGAYGQPDYVYFLYIGHTPGDIANGEHKAAFYMEQYDWDGNPIRKYKINHFGRFVVDEKEKQLYVCFPFEDDPIYVYELP